MADVEHQKTPDGRRNVTGADDKEDAAVSTGAKDKNGEWYIRYKWMQHHKTADSRVVS